MDRAERYRSFIIGIVAFNSANFIMEIIFPEAPSIDLYLAEIFLFGVFCYFATLYGTPNTHFIGLITAPLPLVMVAIAMYVEVQSNLLFKVLLFVMYIPIALIFQGNNIFELKRTFFDKMPQMYYFNYTTVFTIISLFFIVSRANFPEDQVFFCASGSKFCKNADDLMTFIGSRGLVMGYNVWRTFTAQEMIIEDGVKEERFRRDGWWSWKKIDEKKEQKVVQKAVQKSRKHRK